MPLDVFQRLFSCVCVYMYVCVCVLWLLVVFCWRYYVLDAGAYLHRTSLKYGKGPRIQGPFLLAKRRPRPCILHKVQARRPMNFRRALLRVWG